MTVELGTLALIALVGALLIFAVIRARRLRSYYKRCPDCASTLPAAANVCRRCGYRFES